jgi:HK97 family phage portal protein
VGFFRDLWNGEGRFAPEDSGEESRTLTADALPWAPDTGYGVNRVTPVSQDRALSLAPVYAAVSLISGDISTMPVKAYRRVADERQPMNTLPQLFDRLYTSGEIVPWLRRCLTSLLLRGNAYGLVVERDGFGFPIEITWLDPSRLSDDGLVGRTGWLYDGRPVPAGDIVHIANFVVPGQVQGLSPIGAFAQTLGVGLYAQAYGHDYFANGGTPPGTFRNTTQEITDQQQVAAIKARLGAAIRTREPLVMGKDWEWKSISVSPQEAQFLETIRATATQVANIYRIPPEEIGGDSGKSMTYSTVELNQIKLIGAYRPWLVLLETAFSALLPDRQYVRFNADALIRTDLRTQHEVLIADIYAGIRSRDEVRRILDLPPLPDDLGAFQVPQPALPAAPAVPSDQLSNVVPMKQVNQ